MMQLIRVTIQIFDSQVLRTVRKKMTKSITQQYSLGLREFIISIITLYFM